MQTNLCTFPKNVDDNGVENRGSDKCGLYFRNIDELVHHIEEEHIPLIESKKMAEFKQLKEQFSNDPSSQEQYEKAYAALLSQPIPLSVICRMRPFPKGYKVYPIPPPKPRTLKFCHYKSKPQPAPSDSQNNGSNGFGSPPSQQQQQQSQLNSQSGFPLSAPKKLAQVQLSSPPIRQPSATPSDGFSGDYYSGQEEQTLTMAAAPSPAEDPRRFRCEVDGCARAYKNQQGLRTHMRNQHGASLDGSGAPASALSPHHPLATPSRLSASEESILSRQLPGRQSPFVAQQGQGQQSVSATTLVLASANAPPMRAGETKYQCQHCQKSKTYKTLSTLNKHLFEAHNIVMGSSPASSGHSSRYPSPVPMATGAQQQVYSAVPIGAGHQPHRAISSSSSITIVPASKAIGGTVLSQSQISLQQQQQIGQHAAFIAPTITSRHHQTSASYQQMGRPSAPVPPSTPPGASGSSPATHQQHVVYSSPQSSQTVASLLRSPHHTSSPMAMGEHRVAQLSGEQQTQAVHPQAQHYYVTPSGTAAAMDQQPPVLLPQQQPTSARNFRTYTYSAHQPQAVQQQQRQQPQEQQMYPTAGQQQYSAGGGYGGGAQQQGTTTIYVTHQGHQPQYVSQQQQQQMAEVDQQHGGYANRSYQYQQQSQQHYAVEPVSATGGQAVYQGGQAPNPSQLHPSSSSRLAPTTSTTIRVTQNYMQQPAGQQYQQVQQTPPRGVMYQQQQQPYMASIRTTPVQQAPQHQRIAYQSQQQHYYGQPQQHSRAVHHQNQPGQRSSPATVAAVLAAASPQQGGYGGGQQQQQEYGTPQGNSSI